MSSKKKITKHTNVKYYIVKSRNDSGEVIVQWYSCEKMLGDFFSQPLTGSIFLRFRRKIKKSKNSDWAKNLKSEKPKDEKKSHTKQDTATVSVGMKKAMKSGYLSKKVGQKAIFISLSARQPHRKGPVRVKTAQCYHAKPVRRCSRPGKYIQYKDKTNHYKSGLSHQAK